MLGATRLQPRIVAPRGASGVQQQQKREQDQRRSNAGCRPSQLDAATGAVCLASEDRRRVTWRHTRRSSRAARRQHAVEQTRSKAAARAPVRCRRRGHDRVAPVAMHVGAAACGATLQNAVSPAYKGRGGGRGGGQRGGRARWPPLQLAAERTPKLFNICWLRDLALARRWQSMGLQAAAGAARSARVVTAPRAPAVRSYAPPPRCTVRLARIEDVRRSRPPLNLELSILGLSSGQLGLRMVTPQARGQHWQGQLRFQV